jgi:hypothetical protein
MCDLAYLIKGHLPAVFQLFSNEPDLAPYGIGGASRTKCLSTAVLMMYLFLGRDAMQHTAFCDVPNVRKRYATADHSQAMIDHLIADVIGGARTNPAAVVTPGATAPGRSGGTSASTASEPSTRTRTLYYVMITDGRLPPGAEKRARLARERAAAATATASATASATATATARAQAQGGGDAASGMSVAARHTAARSHHAPRPPPPLADTDTPASPDDSYWPGHVFVLDRQPRGTINMLQAYINSYDLDGVIEMNRSVSMSRSTMLARLQDIKDIFSRDVWTPESTAAWERVSHVNESRHEGNEFRGRVLMCYSRVDSPTCIAQLRVYLTAKIADLRRLLAGPAARARNLGSAVYGNTALYRKADKHLTNDEMLRELVAVHDKM